MDQELTDQTDDTTTTGIPVDDSTAADAGQSAPLVQQDNAAPESVEAKKERISQKQWQEKTEKAKELDAIAESLGVKPGEKVKVVEVLQKQIADLKSESERKEFEAQVPKVRTDKYADAWKKITEAKRHLIQTGDLSYDDLWKMIRDEGEYKSQKEAVQETQKEEQAAFAGSVPFFGNSVSAQASDKLTGLDKEIAQRMNWSEKNYQSAGVL